MTRRDLPPEQMAVQAIHAAFEAAKAFPCETHPHVCLCAVRDEARLRLELAKLDKAGIKYRTFVEPDLENQLTAFACQPVTGELRRHFRNFQLLKFPTQAGVAQLA